MLNSIDVSSLNSSYRTKNSRRSSAMLNRSRESNPPIQTKFYDRSKIIIEQNKKIQDDFENKIKEVVNSPKMSRNSQNMI